MNKFRVEMQMHNAMLKYMSYTHVEFQSNQKSFIASMQNRINSYSDCSFNINKKHLLSN